MISKQKKDFLEILYLSIGYGLKSFKGIIYNSFEMQCTDTTGC